jgi:hypothetical protein
VQQDISRLLLAPSTSTITNVKGKSTNTGTATAKVDGISQFLHGKSIVSVAFNYPILFDVYSPVENNGKETLSKTSSTQQYTKLVTTIALERRKVSI